MLDANAERLSVRLGRFDLAAAEFRASAGEWGPNAGEEIEMLWELAGAMIGDVRAWAERLDGLAIALERRLEAETACGLIVEVLFDPILVPEATRVLCAALEARQAASS
ncbi:MAG: hypothetical protein ACRED8_10595 [Caulobacteraceae bacterium]